MSIVTLLIIGSIAHFLATLTYVRNAYLGRSKPNRVTFFLWAAIPMIAVVAGLSEGATWVMLPVFMAGFGPFLIFCASFFNPNAYWKLGRLDYMCGALALVAIVLWVTTQTPGIAVLFAILADALATYPTILKSWSHPETETGIPYIIAFLTEWIGVLALSSFEFSEYAFLSYLLLANLLLIISVYRKNPFQKLRAELAR